jgi:hypothetical protein
MTLHLAPAYGRDYKSRAEVLRDFAADKDFIVQTFGMRAVPVNRSGLVATGEREVNIRYDGLRKVVVVPVGSAS